MANIVDYIKWRGDISFSFDPFNYVDNLALAELIYLNLDDILKDKTMTMSELYDAYTKKFSNLNDNEIRVDKWARPELLEALASSKRFGNAKIHHFESIFDEDDAMQFGAMMIDLPDGTTYVCYRGTDSSVVGWQENFMSTYTETPGQKEALKYLEDNYHGFRKIRIGGHSKGGYLATYAAAKVNNHIKKRIIKIYSNDGPGLGPLVYDEEEFNAIKDRYIRIIPETSVVGMAFDNGAKSLVIKTDKGNNNSHNGYNWLVERNRFINGELSERSKSIKQAFEQFINDTTPIQRQSLTEEFFKIMKENNINTVSNIDTNNMPAYLKAIKSLIDLDNSKKEIVGKFIRVFTLYYEEKVSSFINKIEFMKKKE